MGQTTGGDEAPGVAREAWNRPAKSRSQENLEANMARTWAYDDTSPNGRNTNDDTEDDNASARVRAAALLSLRNSHHGNAQWDDLQLDAFRSELNPGISADEAREAMRRFYASTMTAAGAALATSTR
ncbi:MAG: hypothetical protein ACLRL4_04490 [Bifidobacterium bifidum]